MMSYQRRILSGLMACLFALLLFVPVRAADPVEPDYGIDFLDFNAPVFIDLLDGQSLYFIDGAANASPLIPGFSGTRTFEFRRSSVIPQSAVYLTLNVTGGLSGLSLTFGDGHYAPDNITELATNLYTFTWMRSTQTQSLRFDFTWSGSGKTAIYFKSAVSYSSRQWQPWSSPTLGTLRDPRNTSSSARLSHGSAQSYTYANGNRGWTNNVNAWSYHVQVGYSTQNYAFLLRGGYVGGRLFVPTDYVDVTFDQVYSLDGLEFVSHTGCPIINVSLHYVGPDNTVYPSVPCQLQYSVGTDGGSLRGQLDFAAPVSQIASPASAGSGILYLDFDVLPASCSRTSDPSDFTLYFYYTLANFGVATFADVGSSQLALFTSWYESFVRSQMDTWTVTFSDYMDAILAVLGQNSPELDQAAADVAYADQLEGQYVSQAAGAASGITNMSTPLELTTAAPVLANVASLVSGSGALVPLFSLLVLLPVSVGIIAKLLNGGD